MKKRENETHLLRDLIPDVLKENKLQKGMDQMDVKEAWENVMGVGVMRYTEHVHLSRNTLVIKLSSSTLREELSYGKDKIIKMLNESLNTVSIKSIKLI